MSLPKPVDSRDTERNFHTKVTSDSDVISVTMPHRIPVLISNTNELTPTSDRFIAIFVIMLPKTKAC